MLISADVPDELAAKIDALVTDGEIREPAWPFETRQVAVAALPPTERRKLEEYNLAYAAYEEARRTGLRSRSAVIKMILGSYFNNGNSK